MKYICHDCAKRIQSYGVFVQLFFGNILNDHHQGRCCRASPTYGKERTIAYFLEHKGFIVTIETDKDIICKLNTTDKFYNESLNEMCWCNCRLSRSDANLKLDSID